MYEPVSEGFPARGEITGNFPENGLIFMKTGASPATISMR
jgi:hypothetical protein